MSLATRVRATGEEIEAMSEATDWWEALYEKLTGKPHPARAPLPACGVRGCVETSAHSHAPGTGWIRPDSWDYENNCPRK